METKIPGELLIDDIIKPIPQFVLSRVLSFIMIHKTDEFNKLRVFST